MTRTTGLINKKSKEQRKAKPLKNKANLKPPVDIMKLLTLKARFMDKMLNSSMYFSEQFRKFPKNPSILKIATNIKADGEHRVQVKVGTQAVFPLSQPT